MLAQLQKLADALECDVAALTGASASDPRLREFTKPDDQMPLSPAEVGLIGLWRALGEVSRDQILNHATALLTQDRRKLDR
jgi:hypothetical protein